ncbi:MAG: hypothetical protein M0T80_04650, partial [Actinomycetota bacterium]|nr:hypothetical protein [Actinomycetota bacterium]
LPSGSPERSAPRARPPRRSLAAAGLAALGGALVGGSLVAAPPDGGIPRPAGADRPTAAALLAAAATGGAPGELALVSRGHLVVIPPGGTARRVVPSVGAGQPDELSWSEDGRWLAFLRAPAAEQGSASTEGSLWVVAAGSAHPREVLPQVSQFAWDPRTDVLAAAVPTTSPDDPDPVALVPIRPSGAPLTASFPSGLAGAHVTGIAWSPAGTTLAVSADFYRDDRGEIALLAGAGGGAPVHAVVVRSASNDGEDLVGWWPSGRGLLYWADPYFSASLAADGTPLVAYDLSTRRASTLATMLDYPDWLAWSPDGGSLAIVAGVGRTVWDGDKHLVVCQVPQGTCHPEPQPGRRTSIDPAWTAGGELLWAQAAGTPAETMGAPPGVDTAGEPPFGWAAVQAWASAGNLEATHAPSGEPAPGAALVGGAGGEEPTPAGAALLLVRHGELWLLPPGSRAPRRLSGPLGPYGPAEPGYYGYVPWYQTFAWHAAP